MTLLDFILNIAALLIWLSWCARRHDLLTVSGPATLVGTLRPAEPSSARGWQFLLSLGLLLILRAVFYFEISSAVGWTPKLNCGLVVLAFPADKLGSCLIYSVLSFGRVLIVYCFWVAVLLLLNSGSSEAEPVLKLLRLQLGVFRRWPAPLLMALPSIVVLAGWVAIHTLLVRISVISEAPWPRVFEQGLLLCLALLLTLKYILPALLLVDLAASYVYLGQSPAWDFTRSTARRLLVPLRWVPLRWGKIDLAPIIAILLVLLLLHWGPQMAEARLNRARIFIWPS